MGKTIEELKRQQAEAMKTYDLSALSAINKQLFEIREQVRKRKAIERQKAYDEKMAQKIEKILEKGE